MLRTISSQSSINAKWCEPFLRLCPKCAKRKVDTVDKPIILGPGIPDPPKIYAKKCSQCGRNFESIWADITACRNCRKRAAKEQQEKETSTNDRSNELWNMNGSPMIGGKNCHRPEDAGISEAALERTAEIRLTMDSREAMVFGRIARSIFMGGE